MKRNVPGKWIHIIYHREGQEKGERQVHMPYNKD
jgi:hypothetical protein